MGKIGADVTVQSWLFEFQHCSISECLCPTFLAELPEMHIMLQYIFQHLQMQCTM